MENQDQRKIHAPENHGGVHLCHKCGWPFPNPHPSARHRRAHKRVCGKIEGHKLIDSEGSNHSTLSDDEHASDDDNKNPIIVETVKTEKGIDESKEKLKRSEEDVFSDAVADFSESKLAGNTKDSASVSEIDKKEELTSSQSFKDCEISDLVQLPSTLSDNIELHKPEVGQSAIDELEAGAENTPSQQSPNFPTDIYIDRENMDSQSNVAVETNQPELKIEEIIERASDLIATEEVVRLKEGHSACIDPEIPQADMASEVAAKSCSSDYLVESNDGGGEEDRNKNVHTVSVLDDLNISDHSEALLKDFKDHKGVKVQQPENTDSIKGMEEGEDKSFLCKPLDEIPVREPDATEMKFIDSDNPKEEQEIDRIPKGSFPVDCSSNFSEVASVVEDAPREGFDLSDICKENPDTKIEEMKRLELEHLPMVEKLPETDRKDIDCVSESSTIVINSNTHDGKMEPENSKPILGPVNDESLIHSSATMEDDISAEVGGAVLISEPLQVEGNNIIEEMKGLEEEHLPMVEKLPKTDRKDIDCVSESSTIVINSNAHDGKMERENSKPILGPVNDESLIHSSSTMEDNISEEVGGAVLISEPLQVEGNNIIDKPVVTGSPIDVLADSSSQADSVEATWGSVLSGLSIRSDAPAIVEECKDIPQTFDHAAAAGDEKSDGKMQKAASQNSEKSDAFEPPSFTTLVEQGEGDGPNASDSKNQNTKEPQAGWFPSFTPDPSDLDGRKKNEELIAKVTNWKAGKQHTPLKNLLGEAALEAKPKLPKPENLHPPVQNDEKTAKNKGGTINSSLGLDSPTTGESAKKTSEKEWDSPARLPEEIKKEKKKGKGRPYWAQFVCCTSANY